MPGRMVLLRHIVYLVILASAFETLHAQPHPRITIQRQRVVQSCGAVIESTQGPGSFTMSGIVGLTTIGTTWAALRSQALFGFFVPMPIILSADRNTGDVATGHRTWAWPNPFRENVQILVQLSGAKATNADVYDNIGQLVATIPIASLHDDAATFMWDGKSTDGSQSATGSYTVRVNVTEPYAQRRIMYSTTITRIR